LNLYITGSGNTIKSFKLNGKEGEAFIPVDLKGEVRVEMEMQ
jgi:hypothetical protein